MYVGYLLYFLYNYGVCVYAQYNILHTFFIVIIARWFYTVEKLRAILCIIYSVYFFVKIKSFRNLIWIYYTIQKMNASRFQKFIYIYCIYSVKTIIFIYYFKRSIKFKVWISLIRKRYCSFWKRYYQSVKAGRKLNIKRC